MSEHPAIALWERLTATAVLGTARAMPELPATAPETLSRELERASVADPDERLLRWAALLSAYVRTGARPSTVTIRERNEAPVETLAPSSARSAAHLEAMLFGQYADLLDEWSGAAAQAGVRVREELVAALLEHLAGVARAHGLSAVEAPLRVIGARGEWLAARNGSWQFLLASADTAPEKMWGTGTRHERFAAFLHMRRSDAAAAREHLAKSFSDETPEDRERFVEAMAIGLSEADEPFLENVLDDRRKAVRMAAAQLLYQLPESRLARRMADRARGLVKTGEVHVTLPEALDAGLARDGINPKRFPHLGDKARLLSQIIAATPLDTWSGEATVIVTAFLETDFADALLLGLAFAATRQRHAAFAEAVLDRIVNLAIEQLEPYEQAMPQLLGALSNDRYRVFIERLVTEHGRSPALPSVLLASERPLDAALSRRILAALRTRARRGMPAIEWELQRAFKGSLARRLDPSVHAEAREGWPTEAAGWTLRDTDVVETLATTLAFRFEMLDELKERSP